ncbi:Cytochrome P450 [Melia azedarach]|uniref:Cytochrome P450 n=1 Tax=Melia azedarach TaxID=155640 RepID=A0ACC1Z2S5_MELAZ|nr:Cytochrome P450 [Melia azedarach]
MTYNHSSMFFSPCNDYWRKLRKISVLELLSNNCVQSFRSIREEEVGNLVEFISSNAGQNINLSDRIFSMTTDVISRAAFGDNCRDQRKFNSLVEEILPLSAANETSATSMEWAISELLKNPGVMKKAQEEIRQACKGKNKIEEDIQKLDYLKAVIKESFRLQPPAPLNIRLAAERSEISGYTVPASTKIIVNNYAIGRDPTIWKDPECFRPERFEGSSIDFKGNHFELIPFGGGRGFVQGYHLLLALLNLNLLKCLYYFDWKLPNGIKLEDLDV